MILRFIKEVTSTHILSSSHYRWCSLCREPSLPCRDHPNCCIILLLCSPVENIIVLCIFSLRRCSILTSSVNNGCIWAILRGHVKLTWYLCQRVELLWGINLWLYCSRRCSSHSECGIVSSKICSLVSILSVGGNTSRTTWLRSILNIWSQSFNTFLGVIHTTEILDVLSVGSRGLHH
jgi:hypothetical protein